MASNGWQPPNVPDLGGLEPTSEHLRILAAIDAGHVHRRRVYRRHKTHRDARLSDVIDLPGTTPRMIDMAPYWHAGLAGHPAVPNSAYSPVVWYLTARGQEVHRFYGSGTPTSVQRLRLVHPNERRIPEMPTRPGAYDLTSYIAAVFLDTAARLALRRPLSPTCTSAQHWGVRRRCNRTASEANGWSTCVHCLIAEARHDYAAAYPHLVPAALADSMVVAFEAAEREALHVNPPADPVVAADLLAAVAYDLYNQATPANVQVARTA